MSIVNLTLTYDKQFPIGIDTVTIMGDDFVQYFVGEVSAFAPDSPLTIIVNQNTNLFEVNQFVENVTTVSLTDACYNMVQYNQTGIQTLYSLSFTTSNQASTPVMLPNVPTGPITVSIQYNTSIDTNQWSDTYCCLHEKSLVETVSGNVPIQTVKAGDLVVDAQGRPVRILQNVRFSHPSRQFVQLSKKAALVSKFPIKT